MIVRARRSCTGPASRSRAARGAARWRASASRSAGRRLGGRRGAGRLLRQGPRERRRAGPRRRRRPRRRKVARANLSLEGFEVLVASSGAEALARLAESDPLAIVSDLKMPDLDGIALMERVHAVRPGAAGGAGHRPRHRRDRGRGDAAGGDPLPHQADPLRRAGAGAAPRGGERAGPPRRGAAARRAGAGRRLRGAGRLLAGHARGLRDGRPGGADRRHRPAARRDRAPARSWWRGPSTGARRAASGRSSRSTAPPSRAS